MNTDYIAKTITETMKLSPCLITLTENRVNSDQIKLLYAELDAKHWVDPISITHDSVRHFFLQSEMSLPSACSGKFTEVEDAYAAIVGHLSTGDIMKYKYQLALKVEDLLTPEQEIE